MSIATIMYAVQIASMKVVRTVAIDFRIRNSYEITCTLLVTKKTTLCLRKLRTNRTCIVVRNICRVVTTTTNMTKMAILVFPQVLNWLKRRT